MSFKHKLSKRLALSWMAALSTAATIFACGIDQQQFVPTQPTLALSAPNTVSDLGVTATTDTSVTLSLTEVEGLAGAPASYLVRFAAAPISWGSANDVTQGTCAVPMAGTTIGAARSCTVLGLAPGSAYQFQLVSYSGTLNLDAVFGGLSNVVQGSTSQGGPVPPPVPPADSIFADGFESGTLSAWQDGVNASLHRVLTDASQAHSGNRVLEVTYPAGSDGGWLTHFLMPGYDSLFVSAWVRFPTTWQGGTKLLAFYGSRTDNQWSAFGQAGKCPTGTDFFAAMVVAEGNGSPGATRFYSYYPAMARESDGVTCWGRFGNGAETYVAPLAMSAGAWHHVEFWMKLNTPNLANAEQAFWIDGVQRGTWNGLQFRTSSILALNSVQLTFSNSESTQQTQRLYVDDVVVSTMKPGAPLPPPPPPPPPPVPAPVASVSVGPASASINVGGTQQLSATVKDSAGNVLTDRTVSWASGNAAVATVSGTGLVSGIAAGSATVTAASEGVSGAATVSVTAPPPPPPPVPVASIVVAPVSASITVGGTRQFAATVKDSSGNLLAGRVVSWASSNAAVVSVSASGLGTAVAAGSASITATSEGVSGSASVSSVAPVTNPGRVTNLAVSSVGDTSATLSFTEVTDGAGNPASYEVRFGTGSSWGSATRVTRGTCNVPMAGTAVGATRTCTVLGLIPNTTYRFQLVAFRGTLNVNAVFGALSNQVSKKTKLKAVASVSVTPDNATLTVGATRQITAVVKDNAGNTLTGRSVTWASSNTGVATVGTGGLATAKLAGSALIIATSEGVKDTSALSITGAVVTNPGAVTNLAVSSTTASSVTLSFKEVTNGAGQPASYEVKYAAGSLSWGSASVVTQGTCAVPLAGTVIGATRTCTVQGLASSAGYQFQLVAYRGTLNVDAVFGALSNIASGTTAGSGVPAPVASVTVSPSSSNLLVGGGQQLSATMKDAAGNTLTGRAVTWSSSNSLVASIGGTGLVAGVLAGSATMTATSEGMSGTGAVSVSAGGGGTPGSNEPAGFRLLNDQAWNSLTGNGWNYLRRASAIDASIVTDATAPVSPSNILRIAYSAGCCTDAEPSVHWMSVPGVQEIYTSWSMKLSPNWIPNPAGGGKITFLWTNGVGQVYTNLYHQAGTAETGWTQGPPYRIGLNTEWSPYGQKIWLPNVATTGINPGEWHKVEVYYRWGTSGNGVIRWWVDGVLNGEYSNVSFPTSGTNFSQFEFAPTVQFAGSQDRYMYIDHTHVSVP